MRFSGKVKSLFIIFLVCFSLASVAQVTDSLWNVWKTESNPDSIRYDALKSMYWKFCYVNPDSAFDIADLIYSHALENDNKEFQAKSFKFKGIVKDVLGENEESLRYYSLGLEITESEGFGMGTSSLCRNAAMVYRKMGNLDLALEYCFKSLEVCKKIGWKKGENESYNSLGVTFQKMKNMPLAIYNFQESLKISEELGDESGIARAYQHIGLIYWEQGDLEKAIDYLLNSKDYYEKLDSKRWLTVTYNNLGIIYKDLNEFEKAKQYLTDGLILAKERNSQSDVVSSQVNLGNIYKIQNEFVLAMEYYNKALVYLEKHKDIGLLANLYFNIGSLNNKQGKYTIGKRWCEKAYNLSTEHKLLQEKMQSCECLKDANKKLGNIDQAYNYLTQYYSIRDSIHELADDNEVNRLEMQYEFDKQHLADSLVMEEQKLIQKLVYQEELNNERMQRNASIYFVIGLLIFALLLFARLYLQRKTNKKLAEKNKIIEYEKQRAEESERAKEQFFNNVSHEFRTPLTLILGPLDKIIQSTPNDDFKQELGMVQRNANRLYNMIDELLNLYKLESGTVKLKAKKDDLGQFIYRFVQSFEPLAKQKKINLSFIANSELFEVYFDGHKIEMVLSNLLSNAFKFVDEGGKVVVSVETKTNPIDGAEGVLVSVTDNGIGIPDKKIDHVFDRFYQVDESLSRNFEGTGIGLSLTKELVELHKGWITAKSENEQGATFSFFLPFGLKHLKPEQFVEGEPLAKSETDIKKPLENEIDVQEDLDQRSVKKGLPVLLVVEDNPDMRSYIKSDLSDKYRILEAGNGHEGLEMAIENVPDLIVSDIMMPKMDGNEMSLKLKKDERTSHIPIILVTARTSTEQKIEGLETGADAYISKPFNPRELQVRIKNLIDQRQQLRSLYENDLGHAIRLADTNITSMDQQFLEKALNVVEENISNSEFTVELFGNEMAMSRVQLHRKLSALTNQSASRFIRAIRMKYAAEYLAKDGATVTETAYKFGFNNLSYFAKCFSEDYKMTPSEWVANHNNGNRKS